LGSCLVCCELNAITLRSAQADASHQARAVNFSGQRSAIGELLQVTAGGDRRYF
jgi:hypothetical protein